MITEWDGVKLAKMSKTQLVAACQEIADLLTITLAESEKLQRQFSELSQLTIMPINGRRPHA